MRALALAVALALAALPAGATAQAAGHPSPWALGIALAGGGMVSTDQRDAYLFDGGGGLARLELRARPFDELGVDWLETDLHGAFTIVGPGIGGAPGGVLELGLGVRLAPRTGDVRPYVLLGFGVGFTGPLIRPVGSGAIGLAFQVTDEIGFGPELDLQHVIQWDGPRQSSDAVFLSIGAAFTYRPVPHTPPPPVEPEILVVTEEHTTVITPPREVFVERAPPPPVAMDDLMFLVDGAVCGTGVDVVTLLPPVLFDHDQDVLTPAGEVAMHDVLARVLEAPPDARIVVEGHADVTGTSDHNERLARARAHTVATWLAAHGVPRASLRETGHGARSPLVAGDTTDALAPNRRVTIRIEHDGTVAP